MSDLVCFTLPYQNAPFERALEGIRGAGYGSIGFGLSHADGPAPKELTPKEAERIRRLCDRFQLKPAVLYGAKAETDDAAGLCRWVDFACDLGAGLLVWLGLWGYRKFPGEPKPQAEMDAAHPAFVEKIRRVGEYAAEKGIVITLKPHTGNTATGPILAKTLQEIGSPSVLACLDPGNVAFYEGEPPEEDVEAVADRTAALIMKDHRGPRANPDFPVPGEGDIDFVRILRRLKESGFSGPLIVERIDGADGNSLSVDQVDRRLRRARENCLRIAREAGYPLPLALTH